MRKSLALCLVALAFVATNAFAVGEGRLTGKVLDAATKEPIPNAVLKITATEMITFNTEVKVNAKGEYALFVVNAAPKYKFVVSADGYVPYEQLVKIPMGGTTPHDFNLTKVSDAQAAAAAEAGAKGDPAVDAYNAGAALANAGDWAGANAKFEEALKVKPDLTAAWIALAKASVRTKQYPRAIEAANKVLEIDNEDMDMWSVLAQAYTATGDKAKAAEAQAKLPKNASALFNEAARVLNAGNDAEGEKLLKQAIAADDKMAVAYYELGMIYVRGGKSADAKAALTKYLELDPNGKDAATAKEMMNYLK
jgi:tetratricopeptide (TPR) repeat protein